MEPPRQAHGGAPLTRKVSQRILERRNTKPPSTISINLNAVDGVDTASSSSTSGTGPTRRDATSEHLPLQSRQDSSSVSNLKWTNVSATVATASSFEPSSAGSSAPCEVDDTTTASIDSEEEELLTRVENILGRRLSAWSVSSAMGSDAFVRRLSELSTGPHQIVRTASYGSSSTATKSFKRHRFPDADNIKMEEMTQRELIQVLECTRDNLKRAEMKLVQERQKRKSRDHSLLKLARELGKARDTNEQNKEELVDLKRELETVRADLILVQRKLEHQKDLMREQRSEHKHEYDRALRKAKDVYHSTVTEHDKRIREIGKSHARQCEDLCREIIQANKEASQLRSEVISVKRRLPRSSRYQLWRTALALMALVCCLCAITVCLPVVVTDDDTGALIPGQNTTSTGSYQIQIRNPVVLRTIPRPVASNSTSMPTGIRHREHVPAPFFSPVTSFMNNPDSSVPSKPIVNSKGVRVPLGDCVDKSLSVAQGKGNGKKLHRIVRGVRKWFGKRAQALRKALKRQKTL